jgi:hypothetical protein
MSKRRKQPSGKEAEKRLLSRRAILAGLGIGAALPAVRGFGQTGPGSGPGSSPYEAAKKKFDDDYWPEIKKVIDKRDKASGEVREVFDLEIHQMRTDFLASTGKSGFPRTCPLYTPTPR